MRSIINVGVYAGLVFQLVSGLFEAHAAEPNLKILTNTVRVACGIDTPTETETQRAVRDCFEALQKNLPSTPFQALLIEDNLNQPTIVRAAILDALKNFPHTKSAYISIPWENPPPEFPQDLNAQSAKDRRGLSMAAITGDVSVRFTHAPQLSGPHEKFNEDGDYTAAKVNYERQVAEATPTVREFLRYLDLTGPALANAIFTLPSGPPDSKDAALTKAAENIGIVVVAQSSAERWTSYIGEELRTNEIVLATISGNLGEEDWSRPSRLSMPPMFGSAPRLRKAPFPFQGLSTLFVYKENPRMETYRGLGDVGLRILKNADEVELFRLWLQHERINREVKGAEIDGYVIKSTGPILKPVVKEPLQELMFRAPPISVGMPGCGYDPGIAFRLTTAEGSISALVCFGCADFSWTVRDPKGTVLAHGKIMPDGKTMNHLRQIGLVAFPDFKELRGPED